jgi:hypothetical protein
MKKQQIKRPELAPWPQAKSSIRTGAKIAVDEEPQTTPNQIAKICAAMDKQEAAQKFERGQQVLKEGDYTLPKLPPAGMRWRQPKNTKLRKIR